MLVDPDVGLFRADERVFTAMLEGWRAQMLARGLTTQTIKQRCQLLERFQEFTGEFPLAGPLQPLRSAPPNRRTMARRRRLRLLLPASQTHPRNLRLRTRRRPAGNYR